jgi:hypothetical protein
LRKARVRVGVWRSSLRGFMRGVRRGKNSGSRYILPDELLHPEVMASLIRVTSGNLRLFTRLITQIERVLSINDLHVVSTAVVEAARDSLVLGPG